MAGIAAPLTMSKEVLHAIRTSRHTNDASNHQMQTPV